MNKNLRRFVVWRWITALLHWLEEFHPEVVVLEICGGAVIVCIILLNPPQTDDTVSYRSTLQPPTFARTVVTPLPVSTAPPDDMPPVLTY